MRSTATRFREAVWVPGLRRTLGTPVSSPCATDVHSETDDQRDRRIRTVLTGLYLFKFFESLRCAERLRNCRHKMACGLRSEGFVRSDLGQTYTRIRGESYANPYSTCCRVLTALSTASAEEDVVHILSGVVKHVDRGAKKVVVKADNGTEHVVKWTGKTTWEGTKDAGKGIKEGSQVTVKYTEKAGEKTAVGIEDAGKGVGKAVQ
jgi:Cu/Ag efflux protein CusF